MKAAALGWGVAGRGPCGAAAAVAASLPGTLLRRAKAAARCSMSSLPSSVASPRTSSGVLTALLRWPTSPPGMEMPVVEVHKYGVWLLAKNKP
ncbi:hypothetical protein Taro_018688 [Colocasia esculenta]|uniref:Uncharacterized protein n=1 Tax=Colocasia esculenta TaxID=4460 RepID=A0A843UUG0_COLES|nr:hypothetical protein [Colocasia esculenta]